MTKKIKVSRHLVQLFIWRGRLGIFDIITQVNTLKNKYKYNQKLMNETNALWKDL